MIRQLFYTISILSLMATAIGTYFWPPAAYFLIILLPFISLGIYDIYVSTHNILRNYPVLGHLRYMFEFIRPEIQQYFVATDISGRPFSRETRSLVYERAKGLPDTLPFGTQHNITKAGYQFAYHSLAPKTLSPEDARIMVGGQACTQPYLASRLNASALSFGAISPTAVEAINLGAKLGNFAQNTGEGGLTAFHLKHGGDIIMQVGTGYFGCRDKQGHFDPQAFAKKAKLAVVKMIEIKLSQGAKPSHGGILPAAKVDAQIAEIRGVEVGKDCISPPTHSAFSTPEGLLHFIQQVRELAQGKPVGFKLCIGKRSEFMGICKAMLKTKIYPDFITVDGAEGGTGAAPLEFTNRLGMPMNEAIMFVHHCLVGCHLRDKLRLIASGKVATGFDMVCKIALGADMCNAARAMMFSVGCIQALRCDKNTCPTGVTTQDPKRYYAIVPAEKSRHVANFHQATITSFLDITGTMGIAHPDDLTPDLIYRRDNDLQARHYGEIHPYLHPGALLTDSIPKAFADAWAQASAERF